MTHANLSREFWVKKKKSPISHQMWCGNVHNQVTGLDFKGINIQEREILSLLGSSYFGSVCNGKGHISFTLAQFVFSKMFINFDRQVTLFGIYLHYWIISY